MGWASNVRPVDEDWTRFSSDTAGTPHSGGNAPWGEKTHSAFHFNLSLNLSDVALAGIYLQEGKVPNALSRSSFFRSLACPSSVVGFAGG
jgi:hypothetical protein